jgi:predicted esterase
LAGGVRAEGFVTPCFRGLAVSDERAVYLVFRGTRPGPQESADLKTVLGGWVANLDYRLHDLGGYRVHRGFAREVEAIERSLRELVLDHGAEAKPLYLTGHSAGGALATLAARRLHERGVPVRGAVVFSSPRVGDAAFARTYPVPLVRIERRHDVVPHLPLPPRLARTVGRMGVDRLLERLELSGRVPGAAELKLAETEYLHAGELFYDDGEDALYRVPSGSYLRRFGGLMWREVKADLGRGEPPDESAYAAAACPRWATPVPARLLDAARFAAMAREVMRQTKAGSRDFLLDHHIDGAVAFILRLLGLAPEAAEPLPSRRPRAPARPLSPGP